MPSYKTKCETVTVGCTPYVIRSLLDLQQFSDPDGMTEHAGAASTGLPLFGMLWPSSRMLAELMSTFDLAGKRILEVGAGLALASLVIHKRSGDVTVSDRHPLSESFLEENLALNHLEPLSFQSGDWAGENSGLGLFDLIIGGDVLHERRHARQLALFIKRHASSTAQVIIVDPDRGNRASFCREMFHIGFRFTTQHMACTLENGEKFKGRILSFERQ